MREQLFFAGKAVFLAPVWDAMHAVLCGAGHNLRLLLNRLRAFLCRLYDWIVLSLPFSTGLIAGV